ncbi:MAG: sensor histidine kinase [Bacillota bacterium]
MRRLIVKRYARWPMIYKVMVGSLITLTPPLLITVVLGRQGWLERTSTPLLAVYTAGVIALALYLNYISLRVLFRPLFQLMETVHRLQEGDYRARARGITGDQELARVGSILNEVLDNLERSRRFTSSRTLHALERERKRIARELHDETSQALTTLIINLEISISSLQELTEGADVSDDSWKPLRQRLTDTRNLTESVLEEIRKLIFDLRPSILDDLGLVPAMRWYAMNKLESLGVDSRFEVQGSDERLPADTETALFRIFQEAITNTIKHADADLVVIALKLSREAVVLRVSDDGVGFAPQAAGNPYSGLGLFGMQERASLLGGTLEVNSKPGEGTEIIVRIPHPQTLADG